MLTRDRTMSTDPTQGARPSMASLGHVGVIAALPQELGPFLSPGSDQPLGVPVGDLDLPGVSRRVTAAVSGVGKVAAAHAALALISRGVDGLFVVGTCGGLDPAQRVGDFIHVTRAIQWDLSVRAGRESAACAAWTELWLRHSPGALGLALTADRPAIRWVERLRRARAAKALLAGEETRGTVAVADMETAAVGAVADRAGVPWAALRVVSDAQRPLSRRLLGRERVASSFSANFQEQAARPAEALLRLLGDE